MPIRFLELALLVQREYFFKAFDIFHQLVFWKDCIILHPL